MNEHFQSFREYVEVTDSHVEYQLIVEKINNKTLSDDMEAVRKSVAKFLNIEGSHSFVVKGKNKFYVISSDTRDRTLKKLSNYLIPLGWQFKNDNRKISTAGYLIKGDKIISVKERQKQGTRSSGIGNEVVFSESVKGAIHYNNDDPISVIFVAGRRKKIYTDIVGCRRVGLRNRNRKKADVVLIDSNGKEISISLKKDNSAWWESADSYWGKTGHKYIQALAKAKKITLKVGKDGIYKISPLIAVKATDEQAKDVIFGSDIKENDGCVIQKTFTDKDFSFYGAEEVLVVQATHIIDGLEDVDSDIYPWFTVRHDEGRDNVRGIGYKGLRAIAYKSKSLADSTYRVPKSIKIE